MLDIPNIKSPSGRMAILIEEYMGRPDIFDMTPGEFVDMLEKYFETEKTTRTADDDKDMGIGYYLRCRK